MTRSLELKTALLAGLGFCLATGASAAPVTNAAAAVPPPAVAPILTHVKNIRALDADNQNIRLNRPGLITVIVGTDEDSQNAARDSGKAMYPFQGRPDFALIVVVDLRESLATWVPSMVTDRMRASLDDEAEELKPYYLTNGNKSNPRKFLHVVPDFKGTVCPQLGWDKSADDLRAIIYGVDGGEVQRFDKVADMAVLQDAVRKAIQDQVDVEQARLAQAAKTPSSKILQPVMQHPPLAPYTALVPKKDE